MKTFLAQLPSALGQAGAWTLQRIIILARKQHHLKFTQIHRFKKSGKIQVIWKFSKKLKQENVRGGNFLKNEVNYGRKFPFIFFTILNMFDK